MLLADPAVDVSAEAVRAVIAAVDRAHLARDAAAIGRHFAPGACIADLAPPLMSRGFDVADMQAWLDGWDAPVEVTTHGLEVDADGDLAVAHGLQHTRTARNGEDAAWWCRVTYVFARTPAGWRITHAHSSVPFHMDGSFRAAIDLKP